MQNHQQIVFLHKIIIHPLKGKKTVFLIGFITLFGFAALSLPVFYFLNILNYDLFDGHYSYFSQLGLGLLYGLCSGFFAWGLVKSRFMESIRNEYADMIGKLKLKIPDILFISFCAGVGEELFFRAGLQNILGLWPTSVLFVAIHGYLNPFKPRLLLYGILMVLVIAGLGYLFIHVGILSAMAAHFMIDVVLLTGLVYFPGKNLPKPQEFVENIDYES